MNDADPLRLLRLRALYDRLNHSLFALPVTFVVAAIVGAQLMILLDTAVTTPEWLTSTADNARAVLAAIAGGTITAASVVFSLTLVAVQLSSSQYSPRTLDTFLGDRFQQVVLGIVLGTFTYALLVLNAVEAPREGEASVPSYGVVVAVVMAITALVAVIASINHTAQSLRVASVANRVTDDVTAAIERQFGDADVPNLQSHTGAPAQADDPVGADPFVFGAPSRGWVQQISAGGLLDAAPSGSVIDVVASAGDYLQEGQPVATVLPAPDDPEAVADGMRNALVIGPHRTLQQDVAFGIVQLVDIAVKALSPGVNDPHTAMEVLARIGAVLTELAVRDLSPEQLTRDGSVLIRRRELDHAGFFDMAVEPVRRSARTDPQVAAAVLVMLATVRDEALRRRTDAHVDAVSAEAERLLDELDLMANDADRRRVLDAAESVGLAPRRTPTNETTSR